MTKYIQFKTEDKAISNETVSQGGTVKAGLASTVQSTMENEMILIEVDDDEIVLKGGTVKAGLVQDAIQGTISIAQKPFAAAIKSVIQHSAKGLMESVRDLPNPPSEMEISFGLKATGEAGNVAIGKAGSEANFTVKLVWKSISNSEPSTK